MKTISLETKIILDYISITRASYFSASSDDYLKENNVTVADTEKTVRPMGEELFRIFIQSELRKPHDMGSIMYEVTEMLKSRGLVI